MDADFVFMDGIARPHRANIVDECFEDITCLEWQSNNAKVLCNRKVKINVKILRLEIRKFRVSFRVKCKLSTLHNIKNSCTVI